MKLQKDHFDTDIFDHDVYKLVLDKESESKSVIEEIANINKGLIVCFSPVKSQQIRLLEELKFKLVNIRSLYKLLNHHQLFTRIPEDITVSKYNTESISDSDITKLADTISIETRYGKDELILKSTRIKVYSEWIKNSLFNGYANESFLAWSRGKPIGICTTKVKDDYSEIDLLGVLPEFRGKKVGQALLSHAVAYLESIQNKPLFVVTSGENIHACKLFEQSGFIIDQVELVYHLHMRS